MIVEKVIFCLVVTSRKLRQDFQAHQVIVLSDFPLEDILERVETSGRMRKLALNSAYNSNLGQP